MRYSKVVARNSVRYFSSQATGLSYFHKSGNQTLVYRTLGQQLKIAADKYADREALISYHEQKAVSFAEALDKADHFAAGLLNLGLTKGDRVAIWSPNRISWYISMMGIARAGLVSVGLNPAYKIPELDYCLKKVGVKCIVAPDEFRTTKYYEMLTQLVPELVNAQSGIISGNKKNSLQSVIIDSKNRFSGSINFNELLNSASSQEVSNIESSQSSIQPESCCNIQFTSGTTGKAKAAQISHFNVVNNGYAIGKRQGLDKRCEKICVNVPLFHAFGISICISNAVHHGSTLVMPAAHFSPVESLKAIVDTKCSVIYGTPTMYVDLVAKQKEMKLDLKNIEMAVSGGAIVAPKLVQDIIDILQVKQFKSVYGLSELTAVVFQSLPEEEKSFASEFVGHVSENVEAKVVDRNGIVVPFGTPGELLIRGYSTMMGYYDDEAKTKEMICPKGWLRTGDQFVLFANGYGKIVGRLKEMIIRGGENIFPKEIEQLLLLHPKVKEAHIIGLEDERMGEEVAAFIRLNDGSENLTVEDVKEFCKNDLAHFKIPKFVLCVENYPKTLSGKVQKFKFNEYFANELKNVKS